MSIIWTGSKALGLEFHVLQFSFHGNMILKDLGGSSFGSLYPRGGEISGLFGYSLSLVE
jgi:hypothetical protein